MQPEITAQISTPTELALTGKFDLRSLEPRFDLKAHWPHLPWPLNDEPDYVASNGSLAVAGTTAAYQINLTARITGQNIPPADLTLVGTGSTTQLELAPLNLDLLDGQLVARGPVTWSPTVGWQLGVTASDLNPGIHYPEWPGKLSAALESQGVIGDNGPDLSVKIGHLSGKLRDQPISGTGGIAFRGSDLELRDLDLASGKNRVRIGGQIGERLALTYELSAPELPAVYPGLSGTLTGQGKVSGTAQRPQIVARLNGTGVGYEQFKVAILDLDVDWDGQGGSARLSGTDLTDGQLELHKVTGQLTGQLEQHRLSLRGIGDAMDFDVDAAGGVFAQVWRGTLEKLKFEMPPAGRWQLEAPSKLALAATEARTDTLCLAQRQTRLCLQGGWLAKTGIDAQATLADLDLADWGKLIPGEAAFSGKVDGKAKRATRHSVRAGQHSPDRRNSGGARRRRTG